MPKRPPPVLAVLPKRPPDGAANGLTTGLCGFRAGLLFFGLLFGFTAGTPLLIVVSSLLLQRVVSTG